MMYVPFSSTYYITCLHGHVSLVFNAYAFPCFYSTWALFSTSRRLVMRIPGGTKPLTMFIIIIHQSLSHQSVLAT